MTTQLRGWPAAPGIGIGSVFFYALTDPEIEIALDQVAEPQEHGPDHEWLRFQAAQQSVHVELEQAGRTVNHVAAEIFAVHQLILQDSTITEGVKQAIFDEGQSASAATRKTIQAMTALFRDLDDDYFASRGADVADVGRRLLAHLGVISAQASLETLPAGTVLFARDLTPTDVALLAPSTIGGIALAEGAPTAHSAILARSLGIPLVCSVGQALLELKDADRAVVDGNLGTILVNPEADEIDRFKTVQRIQTERHNKAARLATHPARTRDGLMVPVRANANSSADAFAAAGAGADGIGLLRTEYLFQARATPPAFSEHVALLEQLVKIYPDQVLTIRALDAGGDKPVNFLPVTHEENPFLGVRGIRLLLRNPALLQDQFRAMVQVGRNVNTTLRLMLPMVSTREEVIAARHLLSEVRAEFESPSSVQVGVLIEVPSAAIMAAELAPLVDFFSIGTNDLAQYVLASDRTNNELAGNADPFHPAVLRLIAIVCRAASDAGRPVSLCGEMSSRDFAVPLLLGLGITELSSALPAVAAIKQRVRECSLDQSRQLARTAQRCMAAQEVRELLHTYES